MASKPKDWTGQKFGRLTAIKNTGNKIGGNFIWEYLCDCGKTVELKSGNVVAGDVSSCGCYRKDLLTTHGATIGKKRTVEYQTWLSMIDRAFYKRGDFQHIYSTVSVCDRWIEDEHGFSNFLEDMGPRPKGTSLNRINSANIYSKDTCEWATAAKQSFDRKKLTKNKSGRTGVKWREDRKVWEARIGVDGNKIILYYGDSFEEACAAREEAELRYYGFTKE